MRCRQCIPEVSASSNSAFYAYIWQVLEIAFQLDGFRGMHHARTKTNAIVSMELSNLRRSKEYTTSAQPLSLFVQ